MKEAAKINIDNTMETDEDKSWTARFLYPDTRKPYKLFYNGPPEYKAGDLVARARRATLDECNIKIKDLEARCAALTQAQYRFTRNGQTQPVGERERQVMDEMSTEMDGFFKRISGLFKRLGG